MNGWVWSNGGVILTGENWSTGRKTLYSVGGRWMNEYGAMVEWYWEVNTKPFRTIFCTSAIFFKISIWTSLKSPLCPLQLPAATQPPNHIMRISWKISSTFRQQFTVNILDVNPNSHGLLYGNCVGRLTFNYVDVCSHQLSLRRRL